MTADAAFVDLLQTLRRRNYRFTAVTPTTHATVLDRPRDGRPDLRDIFGWNRPFDRDDLDPQVFALLESADAVRNEDGKLRSKVRVASLADDLFVHSAFPTNDEDAVFFGPDTYRFVRFVEAGLPTTSPARIVDMGAGSGGGGIAIARHVPDARVTLVDVNPTALRYASVNARAAGVAVETLQPNQVPEFDLLIANAPYLIDSSGRTYRDGGDLLGGAISLDWVKQGLARLEPGKMILLYTAAAYVDGEAPLIDAIHDECRAASANVSVEELDPDVFGEELLQLGYEEVERIAAIGVRIEIGGQAG